MRISPVYLTCPYCSHRFPYKPSAGVFGDACPRCRRPVIRRDPGYRTPPLPRSEKKRRFPFWH